MHLARRHLPALVILPAVAAAPAAARDRFAAEVEAGVAYFRERVRTQARAVARLTEIVATGDLDRARRAYVSARPPYEEIEVLAESFAIPDRDIDARPAALPNGETDRDFRGFHRIEILLFRDADVAASLPFARRLERSVAELGAALDDPANFSAERSFRGMVALSNEVAAKKITSEEETWSDQSLLIFRRNLVGIDSQVTPFGPAIAALSEARWAAVRTGIDAARAAVDAVYGPNAIMANPYSGVVTAERRRIGTAYVALRDALAAVAQTLRLAV